MDVVPLAHPSSPLPPLTPARLVTEADLVSGMTVVLLLVGAAYLYGVWRLRRRGDPWPVARTAAFLGGGLGMIGVVTLGGLAEYDTALVSAHMVQHMVLAMVAPIFLALGAPVALALRTLGSAPSGGPRATPRRLPRRFAPGVRLRPMPYRPLSRAPRRALLAVLHSPPVRLLTFPLVAFAIFVVNPFALYFTDLYRLSLANGLVHEWLHLHFLVTGCLFFWPLIGLDPLPGRWPYPGRVLLMLLMVPFHTVLGLTIMQSTTLLAGDWYPSLELGWVDPFADQQLAGGILWAGGEVVSVAVLGVLVAHWIRASEREARRIDRELDRAEAAAARASPPDSGEPEPGAANRREPEPVAPDPREPEPGAANPART